MEHHVPTFAKSIIVKLSFPSYLFLKQPVSLKEQSILTSNYRTNVQPYFSLLFFFFFDPILDFRRHKKELISLDTSFNT